MALGLPVATTSFVPTWVKSSEEMLIDAPLSMVVMLVLTIRVLLSNAREADANWTTDP